MPAVLTDGDRDFLARPRLGLLTVAAAKPSGWPATRPVWFEYTDDGTVQLFSEAESPKVRRIQETPRASLLVANEVGEPENWIVFLGPAEIKPDGVVELARRLARRYWDLTDPEQAAALEGMLSGELVRIVIEPEKVTRYGG